MIHPILEPITPASSGWPGAGLPGAGGCALAVKGVGFAYVPGKTVLEDVTGSPRPGRLTTLLGPNGCGKSTLLKLMLGQLTPRQGRVTLHGQPVDGIKPLRLARQISYVPQRGESGFAFTVRQVVAMGRFAFQDEAFVDEAIQRCALSDLTHRSIHTLSGGQQQRVLVARAWAQTQGQTGVTSGKEEKVLLADEPVSSLDLRQAEAVMRLLRGLSRDGVTVVVVLHGLDLALRWADDVWLMHGGRLVAQGLPDDVLTPATLEPVYGLPLGETRTEDGRRLLYVRQVSDTL